MEAIPTGVKTTFASLASRPTAIYEAVGRRMGEPKARSDVAGTFVSQCQPATVSATVKAALAR